MLLKTEAWFHLVATFFVKAAKKKGASAFWLLERAETLEDRQSLFHRRFRRFGVPTLLFEARYGGLRTGELVVRSYPPQFAQALAQVGGRQLTKLGAKPPALACKQRCRATDSGILHAIEQGGGLVAQIGFD